MAVESELMQRYGSHLKNVLELIRNKAVVPNSTYLMRRRRSELSFTRVEDAVFCHKAVTASKQDSQGR